MGRKYWLYKWPSVWPNAATMLVSRYRPILYMQYLLLFVDLFMNTFSNLLRLENVVLLVLYVIQDVCIMFAVIVVFLLFFNTYIFQAGLVSILINKFKIPIWVIFLYFGLCVGLHVWDMTLRWEDPKVYVSNSGYRALFVFQRLGSVLYYYLYKRTALRLGDPRFYQDSEWIRREFEKRRWWNWLTLPRDRSAYRYHFQPIKDLQTEICRIVRPFFFFNLWCIYYEGHCFYMWIKCIPVIFSVCTLIALCRYIFMLSIYVVYTDTVHMPWCISVYCLLD